MTLDFECFHQHLASAPFEDGVERGWWDLFPTPKVLWPYELIWIAAPPRPNSAERYYLRFLLQNYPDKGPTATLWDPDRNAMLAFTKWPKGSGDVELAFRTNWNNGMALYVPWDRVAMDSHPDWPARYPGLGWKPTHTIVHYLRLTRELLTSNEYRGQ
jgi:hypothetical protein